VTHGSVPPCKTVTCTPSFSASNTRGTSSMWTSRWKTIRYRSLWHSGRRGHAGVKRGRPLAAHRAGPGQRNVVLAVDADGPRPVGTCPIALSATVCWGGSVLACTTPPTTNAISLSVSSFSLLASALSMLNPPLSVPRSSGRDSLIHIGTVTTWAPSPGPGQNEMVA